MMNELTTKIEEYIYNDQTNLGYEINSAWGTGKTYSVNKIREEFKSPKDQEYRWLNISVNGRTERDIDGVVLSTITASLSDPLRKVISNAGIGIRKIVNMIEFQGVKLNLPPTFLSAQPNMVRLRTQLEKAHIKPIFVFDDVERIQNKAALAKLFGVIATTLQEQLQARVIIIVNENELASEVKDFFLKNREKIIAHVTPLYSEKTSAVHSILNGLSGDRPTEVVTSIHDEVIGINETGSINLRTLTVFVSLFNTIWDNLADHLKGSDLTPTQIHEVYKELALLMYREVRNHRETLHNDVDSIDEPDEKSKPTDPFENQTLMYISNPDKLEIIKFITQGLPIDSAELAAHVLTKNTILANNEVLAELFHFRDNPENILKEAQKKISASEDLSPMFASVSDIINMYSLIVFFRQDDLWLISEDAYKRLLSELKRILAMYSLKELQDERELSSMFSPRDEEMFLALDQIISDKTRDETLLLDTTEKIMSGDHNSIIELFHNTDMEWRTEITRMLIGNLTDKSKSFHQKKSIIYGLFQNYVSLSEVDRQQYKDALETITTTQGDAVLKRIAKESRDKLPDDEVSTK